MVPMENSFDFASADLSTMLVVTQSFIYFTSLYAKIILFCRVFPFLSNVSEVIVENSVFSPKS